MTWIMAWIQVGQEIFDKVKDHNEAESDSEDFIENQAFPQKRARDTTSFAESSMTNTLHARCML